MSTPNDLQALLASIRPRPSPNSSADQDAPTASYPPQYPFHLQQQQQQPPYDGQAFPYHMRQQAAGGYRHPSVTSIHSPSPLSNTPPHRGSDVLSPNVPTPQEHPQPQHPDRAVNLLSLLKSNSGVPAAPAAASVQQTQSPSPALLSPQGQETGFGDGAAKPSHAREISASDLVASLFGGGRQGPAGVAAPAAAQPVMQQPGSSEGAAESSSSAAPNPEKEMLLRLLNRSKPDVNEGPARSTSQSPASVSPAKSPNPEQPLMSGARPVEEVLSGKPDTVPFPQQAPKVATPKDSLFTYVNPFEQLAAASPRNRTPHPKSRSASPAVEFLKNRKPNFAARVEPPVDLPNPVETPQSDERAESPILAEEQKEAISQVVGKMVDEIGREIDGFKSVEEKKTSAPPVTVAQQESTQEVLSSIATNPRETAAEAKQEAVDETAKEPVKEIVTTTTTTATPAAKGTTENKEVNDTLPDNWESSAEDGVVKEEERVVQVHNFPLKPFISIVVKAYTGKLATLRDDGIMDIARLKKEFDQLDRSLTSASSDYIVYALAKNGGMRIIRQDDGSDKQVFRSTRDRVFNVALSASQSVGGTSEEQAILGIGVSGTVYWALISRPEKDLFELDALESESLVFPPFPASDENTSGGQLKTRAKRSSRHPGFFAIGRGKNIYVISPHAAMDPTYGITGSQRTVNTEKFFKERALKISTGKAGKDFMFSDDDTVIASLDKTGRLRFWDIRDVINNPDFFTGGPTPAEVRVPLSTFVTGSPTEKSWPTSVLFVDKLRPYVKSIALRYALVGLKQNHTLQLWDIGVGRAVQELKFPHENESDAICSVAYHPSSGIIVVGHPTRNSIYFIHLSAPRYALQPMSQASYIKRASERDSSLPKPDSTACMSGIREISFASKGQLRSLDLLPMNKNAADDSALFELYVMHSRGVTCLNIKKEDLGWGPDNKIVHPVNALAEGFIETHPLETFPISVTDEPSVNGDSTSTPTKVAPKEIVKKTPEAAAEGPSRVQSPTKPALKKKTPEEPVEPAVSTTTNGAEKPEKKKKKKTAVTTAATGEGTARVKDAATVPFTEGAPTETRTVPSGQEPPPSYSATTLPSLGASGVSGSTDFWNKNMEMLQSGVSSVFNQSLGREIEGLYSRFDEERKKWDAASAAKQDQVLRLVSSTLSDNVEKNLARIVSNSIQTEVVPALTDVTSAAVGKQLNEIVAQQLGGVVPRVVRQALPEAVSRAVQQPDVMKVLSDTVTQKLGSQVENEVSKALNNTISPAVKNITLRAAEKIGTDMEKQVQAQMKQYEIQRHNDSAKIDQLTSLVRGLSDTVAAMAATQTGFQNEVLRLNHVFNTRPNGESSGPHSARPSLTNIPAIPTPVAPAVPVETSEDMELAEVAQLMSQGRFEEGSVKWLQSSQQADLFDNLFVRLNPSYLTGLSPIVALSVGVAVTSSLETNVMERLSWLDVVLHTVDLRDADIREVAPKIMDILTQRLESLYMNVAQTNPHDPVIRRIAPLSRRARELRVF
ncbi:uncharacterized protein ACHE_11307S [Aspergillus chevalieri]|uniref:EDC4-like protein pdc1 beta-propeller domain-containing protein n=1 Tax=Aspergillus chevalieri TaxID=182096 RepID=A0A7R7VFL8_ASPCH|nr:uncharacterized protein ACHE_11307S [Aspergillus chevalieri]BCR83905.1 hypothetical protein ACHE_11307S [Aspergillus chevalieri]